MFTPQQIAERLDDRFKLLTGGSRTALPRQQTLRALIDWSYLTLNEMEQDVLRRLAVFSGGWTFEAAEAVTGEMEAMDGLSGLVNKSLVNVEEKEGESRYRYLETLRQYAMEKLLESGDAVDARARHLSHFKDYSRRAEEKFGTLQRLLWLNRLELEHDNLRSALGWALESEPESALQMVCWLSMFWMSRSYLSEGCRWCQAAISRAYRSDACPGVHGSGNVIRQSWRPFHRADGSQTKCCPGATIGRPINIGTCPQLFRFFVYFSGR